jgi:hypothetical protein
MGKYSIAIPMSTGVIFPVRIFYATIFVSASFDMSKVLENATTTRGVLTLTLIFMMEASILPPVAGGQVLRERNN